MEGPRPPKENEYPQVRSFLDQELRPGSQWTLASEYPTAINIANIHNMRIITDEQKVLSHAVMKPLILRTPLAIFKVAAIGSVVTDSQHRNQGLSRKILDNCIVEASKQECDIAMLWTDLYEFYQKLDFELAGTEMSFVFEQEFAQPVADLKFLKTALVSAEAIHRLYQQHTVTSVRTVDEIKKFLQIPNSKIYTAWNSNNQLVAFAIEGKGVDLNGYIHEWGGSVQALISLLSFIRKDKGTSITLISPEVSINLANHLQKLPGVVMNKGFLGMIKIISHDQLFQKIKRAARALGLNNFVLERRGPEVVIGAGGDLIGISDEKDLVRILFGPALEIPHLKQETKDILAQFLPLPLWVWGWDSI